MEFSAWPSFPHAAPENHKSSPCAPSTPYSVRRILFLPKHGPTLRSWTLSARRHPPRPPAELSSSLAFCLRIFRSSFSSSSARLTGHHAPDSFCDLPELNSSSSPSLFSSYAPPPSAKRRRPLVSSPFGFRIVHVPASIAAHYVDRHTPTSNCPASTTVSQWSHIIRTQLVLRTTPICLTFTPPLLPPPPRLSLHSAPASTPPSLLRALFHYQTLPALPTWPCPPWPSPKVPLLHLPFR